MPTTSHSFARTKIQPPRPRSDWIDRAALQARLGNALQHQRLTLLLAPAGWGKTSALARQLAALPSGIATAWVSADEEDDVPRPLAALTAALEPLDLPWQVSPAALGAVALAPRGLRQAADEVVNALAGAEVGRGLVILDDVHRITDPRAFDWLTALVESLPPAWGLVLASRTEPPLPLARWRARGELAEIRQAELRFAADEVEALLQLQGGSVAAVAERAAQLHRSTEGWAAGLRLMLSSGANAASVAGRQHVFDFLADEVLAGMPERLRLFLLRCSVLPELSPARCAHVSAMPEALACFEQVEREGLFVTPLDDASRTLRLHDLFRDFLEDRLQRDHAAELPALLQRAAEHERDLVRAVSWLLRAGAWSAAAAMLAGRGPALLPHGGGPALQRLLGLFPPTEVERHPALDMLRGLCAFHAFDFTACSAAMARAADGFARDGLAEPASLARVYQHIADFNSGRHESAAAGLLRLHAQNLGGTVGVLAAYFAAWVRFGIQQPEAVAPCFDAALDKLKALDDPAVWQRLNFVALPAGLPGAAAVLQRFLRGAALAVGPRASLLRVAMQHVRAALALGAGQVTDARNWLAAADEDLAWLGRPRSCLTENLLLHFAIDAVAGDRARCKATAAAMRADMLESDAANRRTHGGATLFAEMRAAWALGEADWVRAVAAEVHAAADTYQRPLAGLERSIATGMVALLDGRDAEAERCLVPQPGVIERLVVFGGAQPLLLCVDAQRRQGKLDAAAALLTRWFDSLDAGAPAGGGLLAGPQVLSALAAASWGKRLPIARQERLRALAQQATALHAGHAGTPAADGPPRLPAGLTEREVEVLELLAQGQSNKLIARALDLSPFTVKRHVANILDKTATASRTEVAAWWVAQRG
jgi:LuxR family transcriptional regulator, maltose regulon positive regulatory protein